MGWKFSAFADEAGSALTDQIEALKRDGLHYIELRNVDSHNISALPLDAAKQARSQLDAAGIKVHMLGSPIGKIDIAEEFQSDMQRLEHLGSLREVLGCSDVRIFSYFNAGNRPMDEWRGETVRRMRELGEKAQALGLTLYHENERHIFGDLGERVEILVSELTEGLPYKFIFDFDNFHQSGEDVWEVWQRLKDYTDAFHLKDSDKKNQHVPVGQGAGRVQEILTEAKGFGFSGPVVLEPHLSHSDAVMATGAHGSGNQALSTLPLPQSFHIAVEAAQKLLGEVGVAWE